MRVFLFLLIIWTLVAGVSHGADPVVLNLKWEARGNWSSFEVVVEDTEGNIYEYPTNNTELRLDLESGEQYSIVINGRELHTGAEVLINEFVWRSRSRAEDVMQFK